MNWRLYLYMMVTFGTGITGNPARKRLIGVPILLTWMLAHFAYKRWAHTGKTEYENEVDRHSSEYQEDYTFVPSSEDLILNGDSD